MTIELKDPQYTGKNRCIPCTIINAVLIVLLSVVAIFAIGLTGGGVLFIGLMVVLYLKGYVVPKTPQLTKKYLPEKILGFLKFSQRPKVSSEIDIEEELLKIGVVEVCKSGTDLCIAEEIRQEWDEILRDDGGRDMTASIKNLFKYNSNTEISIYDRNSWKPNCKYLICWYLV